VNHDTLTNNNPTSLPPCRCVHCRLLHAVF